ncbi:RagB/SusD family nutrient uptake outer membrane protein [Belliella sp. DSM 111904]|uniref:RagB/SusD family nutrient uptake outer membrane protein n=1 Tax=Belliella filtrata TaxID=2923435 RepID=A0ABS9UYR4_9BACT|nr:RagB/SusD family nutrient uptake outer membrane protein [Belliella filtrata]MCH7409089.1 RagB/SusD family nutrient uptake outer membrane protein [Belliella filtrata]
MKKYIIVLALAFLSSGCFNELDLAPIDATSELTFWQTEEDSRIFLNSMYADLMSADTYLFLSAMTDDAYSRAREDVRNIGSGSYGSSNGMIAGVWSSRYEGIRRANIFFNNVDRIPNINDETRESYKAQARFIRAWHYFHLREFFGGVPLITDEISLEESIQITRDDQSVILNFVYEELEQAINNLPNSYPSDQFGRITRGAAIAFKSRVHMYNQEYEQAESLASQILSSYSLYPNYGELFQNPNFGNNEVILALQYVPTDREHNIQYSLIPPSLSGYANFSPLQELVDSYPMINGLPIDDPMSTYDIDNPYQNRDPRLQASIIYNGYVMRNFAGNDVVINTMPGAAPDGLNYSSNSTPSGYYVSKFYDREARNQVNSGRNLILIRHAEVLLNYAEAKIERGNFTQEDWDATIGAIRARAGLNSSALSFPNVGQDGLREIVRNERRIELAFEAGHRFFDIRRWRIAEDVLNGWATGMRITGADGNSEFERVDLRTFESSRHYLWPIPLRETDLNNNLTQNPNW